MIDSALNSDIDPDLNYDFFSDTLNNPSPYVSFDEYISAAHNMNSFSIINYNIRSFHENFKKFSCGFNSQELPHVLCLTETWFNSDDISNIPNYTGHHVIRGSRSGGISLFVDNKFKSKMIQEFSYANLTIEVCIIEVSVNNSLFIFIGVYRPHSDTITNFNI